MRSSLYTLISLTAAMTFSLAACSGGQQSGSASSPSADTSASAVGSTADGSEVAMADDGKAKEEKQPGTNEAPKQAVKKDVETWALPTDGYLRFDYLLFQQGQQIALKKCLTEKQMAIEVPPVTYDQAQAHEILTNLKAFSVFKPEYAQAHGYHPQMVVEGNRAFQEFMTSYVGSGDLNQTVAISECVLGQVEQYPFLNPLPPGTQEGAAGSEGAAQNPNPDSVQKSGLVDDAGIVLRTLKKPEVQAAAKQWKECMAPLGIEDMPETPQLMPPPSKAVAWFTAGSITGGEPGEEERQVASHDAQCRASSGYSETFYNALYDAYEQDLKEHKDRYVERQKLTKQRENELKQFISENQ